MLEVQCTKKINLHHETTKIREQEKNVQMQTDYDLVVVTVQFGAASIMFVEEFTMFLPINLK